MFIGIAGGAFNQSREQEMGFGDEMKMGPYRLVCQSFTAGFKRELRHRVCPARRLQGW